MPHPRASPRAGQAGARRSPRGVGWGLSRKLGLPGAGLPRKQSYLSLEPAGPNQSVGLHGISRFTCLG